MRTVWWLWGWAVVLMMSAGLAPMSSQDRNRLSELGPWPLWESYKAKFFTLAGRIVDHDDGDRTTSEAQAYGMFFAVIANDRKTFDSLLRWTQTNLAEGDLTANLPAWLWGERRNGSWGVVDANPASDADVWISYTLQQAGVLWNEPRYTALGKALLKRIESDEMTTLPGFGRFLLPSTNGFESLQEIIVNASYLPPQILSSFARISPDGDWAAMSVSFPRFLKAASPRGFAMDWNASDVAGNLTPSRGPGNVVGGSYDAIRVYLWAGMLASNSPRRNEILKPITGMAAYLRHHDVPPERVGDDGQILNATGNIGFSAATIPYLAALGESTPLAKQQARLNQQFDPTTGLYGKDHRYYTQNLALFATGWVEGRFEFDRNGDLVVAWSKP